MKNYWTKDKIVAKGKEFWTFTILDKQNSEMVKETIVQVDERPSVKVIERCETEENGRKVWKPVLIVWEKFIATYTDEKFLEGHQHIRLLEADGDSTGILRMYDEGGEHYESWVMHGLRLNDIDFPKERKALEAEFTFHHALYLVESL